MTIDILDCGDISIPLVRKLHDILDEPCLLNDHFSDYVFTGRKNVYVAKTNPVSETYYNDECMKLLEETKKLNNYIGMTDGVKITIPDQKDFGRCGIVLNVSEDAYKRMFIMKRLSNVL